MATIIYYMRYTRSIYNMSKISSAYFFVFAVFYFSWQVHFFRNSVEFLISRTYVYMK